MTEVTLKKCFKCGRLLPITEFYSHHQMLIYNKKEKIFYVKETNEKLDTIKKHCDFIQDKFKISIVTINYNSFKS